LIHLDTSVLVDAFTGPCRSAPALRRVVEDGERLGVSALALYEWLRGPRTDEQLRAQEALLPPSSVVPFGPEEAVIAAGAYRMADAPRTRTVDIAIAACAVSRRARLWTRNPRDVVGVPGLQLFQPT
jgi:predicted nucleic acid-binding protein